MKHDVRVLAFAIGIFALLVPRAAADALSTAALSSMQTLATCLELCAIDTGYYVSLETLNDVTFQTTNPVWDWLYLSGGPYVMRPASGLFEPERKAIPSGIGQFNAWQGPYVNYQQGTTQQGTAPYDQGSPLDPWGSPYLFFSPLGLVRGDSGTLSLDYYGDQFDRYTLVSLGPDGVMSGDDLIYEFGGGVSTFALTGITNPDGGLGGGPSLARQNSSGISLGAIPSYTVPHGAAITVHGANLGSAQAAAKVLFGSRDLSPYVTAWRPTGATGKVQIDLTLPSDLSGQADLTVQRGGAKTNALSLTIQAPNAAAGWLLYE